MPGHMNVLLAEANVPYESLKEMGEVNPEFKTADVALVVGANDVVNPAAKTSPGSPIYGMPILEVEDARQVVFLKRSMRPGFAGIENELLYEPQTTLLFGDAKDSLAKVLGGGQGAVTAEWGCGRDVRPQPLGRRRVGGPAGRPSVGGRLRWCRGAAVARDRVEVVLVVHDAEQVAEGVDDHGGHEARAPFDDRLVRRRAEREQSLVRAGQVVDVPLDDLAARARSDRRGGTARR